MDTLLKELQEVNRNIKRANKEFTAYKERWYQWNNWAYQQFWYPRWMEEHQIPFEATKTRKNYKRDDVRLSQDEGYNIFSAYKGARQVIEDLEDEFDVLAEQAWFTKPIGRQPRNKYGYRYTLEDFCESLECSIPAVCKRLEKRYWYESRNNRAKS